MRLSVRFGVLLALGGALGGVTLGCAAGLPGGPTVEDAPDRVVLRVRVDGERAAYRRSLTLALMDDGRGASMRMETVARMEHRPLEDGALEAGALEAGIVEHVRFGALRVTRDGEPAPLDGRMHGLERLVLRTVIDARGDVVEPPDQEGAPTTNPDLEAILRTVARIVRVTYPERAVAPGDAWTPEPIEWDAPPAHRVSVVVTPMFTLRDFDRDEDGALVALIDWDAPFRVPPFAAMAGTSLEGAGSIRGTTRVRVDDGVVGRTELDLRLSVGPSGATALSLFRFQAKLTDVVAPIHELPHAVVARVRAPAPTVRRLVAPRMVSPRLWVRPPSAAE